MKNLASIALAIAVLCVANYAGAHDTSGHNARTSHAASIRHSWHDHDKDSDTIWFNFAFEVIDPVGSDDGLRDDDDRTFDRWRDRDPDVAVDAVDETAILEGSPIYNEDCDGEDCDGRVRQTWYMPHIHWNHEHPAPAAPGAPTVSATAGSTTSLDVSWTAPGNAGKPAITSYDLRYRVGSSGSWTDGPQDETGTTAAITGLTAGTEYQVQVRASNDEGDSGWSAAGTGSTSGPANNAPVFSDATLTRSVAENTGANQNVGAGIPAAMDADGDSLTYTMEGADAASFTFDASARRIKTKTGVSYDHEAKSSYAVTIRVSDGAASGTVAVTIDVTDVNEPPEISGQESLSFTENQATELVLATYTATDPEDPDASITRWSLTGTDAGDFTINENGQLTFRNVPDHERPADSGRDNVYNLSVRASDGRYYGYLEVTVTVEDVNEPPAVTGTSTFTYRENGTAALHTFRATDPERSAITWSVSGADDDDFAISETGVLSFASPPNYESPTDSDSDNVYEVTVVARDDASNSGTLDVVVTVTDQNEGPEISGQQSLSFTENQATDRVLATYTATDPEDPNASITRWSLTGTDAGDFAIDESGQLTFRNVPDYERPADSGRDNVYNLSVRASDGRYYGYLEVTVTVTDEDELPVVTGTITFTYRENGTAALHTFRATDPEGSSIEWSLSGPDAGDFTISETGVLSFASPPNHESPTDSDSDNVYNLSVRASDGRYYGYLEVTVTVTDEDELPVVTGTITFTYRENGTAALHTFRATDPEGSSIEWSLSGPDAGDFTISETGVLSFASPPDYESPNDSGRDNVYNLSVRASDGRYYGYLEVTVTVEDVNEPPAVTGTSTFTYRENGTAALHTFRATDPERSAITWSVSGADDDDFAISETGVLSFASPPNHESPTDSARDNVYEVTVVARDDGSNSGTLDVVVTVTDVDEGPEISGRQSLSFPENLPTELVRTTYTATDPEDPGASITRWSLTGTDAGDFTIDENGQLSSRNVPDYERPTDSDRDNVYNLSVRASDGRYYGYLEITVTVFNVNEPPVVTGTDTFTYRENGTATLHTFRATDPEGSAIVAWQVRGTDSDDFTISETGVLSFASPPDYESPTDSGRGDNVYEVRVVARDDTFTDGTLEVVVTVTDVDEGPEISGQESLSFAENQATELVLDTYTATDPEDPSASITRWSLTGTDAGDFVINESGQLTFRNVPDHERPADSGRDNVYNLSVQASDGRNYGYLEVTVTVEDVDEPPAAPGAPTVSATAGSTTSLDVSWTAPGNAGKPAITSYDLRYRVGSSGSWTDGPQDETGATAAISALTAGTEYQVQVRASNDEGDGAWSPSGTGSTNVPTVYVSFEQGTYTVAEGSSVTVTVELSADPERSVMISISRTNQDGADEDDYSLPGNVTFDSGETSQTITFGASVDTVDDDGESVTLGFDQLPPGVSAGTTNVATVSITDVPAVDEDAPTISVQDQTVNEGDLDPDNLLEDEGFPFQVTLSAASVQLVKYKVRRVELASDTATGDDLKHKILYLEQGEIAAGETSVYLRADIILDDTLDEPDETFTLEIYDFENATAGDQTRATITIEDDDDPPSVSVADAEATEGDPAEFAVTLSAASGQTVTVGVATSIESSDTAAAGDFTALPATTLTFMPGDTAETVMVQTTADTLDEPDETFTLTLSSPSNVTLGDATATGTITNNDNTALASVTIAADQPAFTAKLDDVTFTLTRTENLAAALDVAVALTQDRPLLESGDLAQTVTFEAGEATATLIIRFHQFAEHTATEESTLTATVQTGSGYEPGSPNTVSTRIVVADPAVTAWIEATAYTFAEDATGNDATIAVILRTETGVPVPNRNIYLSVSTQEISGQAESRVDYEPFEWQLEFQPSDFASDGTGFTARQEVTLVIVDDALDESDETLSVFLEPALSLPQVVALRQPDGTACPTTNLISQCAVTVTIVDNDDLARGGICERTPRVRDRILVLLKNRHSYKGDCSGVNETQLAKLESLDLGRNPITESAFTMSLRSNDFEGLVNLKRLYLRETGLNSLPAGVFSDLLALETLELHRNASLSSLPYDEFEALLKLTELLVDPEGRRGYQVAGGEGDVTLEVAAGGTATYQVRLTHRPAYVGTANRPTLTVISDTAGVTASPATLRFTKENWFRRQTVTVSAPASAAGATATLSHTSTGVTYDRPIPTVTVRVLENAPGRTAEPLTAAFEGVPAAHDGEAAPAALTASFVQAPAEHGGKTAFKLRIAFSEDISINYRTFRDQSLSVSGGSVTRAKRVDRRRDLWEVTVKPSSLADVTVTLAGGRACGTAGAVCTGDGRALSATISTTVLGPATARRLTGTADDDTLSGQAGDDTLYGGAGRDELYGDGGGDTLYGGDDTLYGGGGHDVLYGDDNDSGAASGDDLLDGGSGDDILYGDGGHDVLQGGADDDTLYGDGGADSLTGGTGADTFVFAAGDGTDTITDFFPEEGDRIDLSAFAGLTGFASLTLTADGDATILDLRAHGGGTVRLEGIAVADLLAADFLWP